MQLSSTPTSMAVGDEDDFLRATRELKAANALYEQLPTTDETRKMYRPLVDITKMNMAIILPYKVTVDTYFKGEMANFSKLQQTMFGYYGAMLRRRYMKKKGDLTAARFFTSMQECARLHGEGKEIMTDTDWDRFDKHLFFKGLDILAKTKVADGATSVNGIKLYPIRLFSTECREFILYEQLELNCPGLLALAKKHRQDIYLTEDFNYATDNWIEEHLDSIKFPVARESEHYKLDANLRLSIIKLS